MSRQTSNVEFGSGAKLDARIPTPISNEITSISKQATVDSARSVMLYAASFTGLGIISALFLPNRKKNNGTTHLQVVINTSEIKKQTRVSLPV